MSEASPPKQLGRKLLLALFATLFTLVVLEVGARIYVTKFADKAHFSRYATFEQYRERVGGEEWWYGLLAPHRYLGYMLAPNLKDGKNRHNALGFRGPEIQLPKPKGEFRIIAVGASTTYSLFVDDYRRTYPAMLEEGLKKKGYTNVTVINAGVPAWTTYEHLINFHIRLQDLQPDMILFKEAFADVSCRLVWPPSAFKGDNSGCFAPPFTLHQTPIYEASTLMRILLVETGRILPASALGQSVFNEAKTCHYHEFAKQRWTWRYPSGIFKEVPVGKMLATNSSKYYRRNVENLVLAAKARGVKVMIMTFPYTTLIPGFFDIAGFKDAVDEHNGIAKALAEQHGAVFFDLAGVFPADKKYWGFDGIHANQLGTDLEATLVTDFIDKHQVIPRPTAAQPAAGSGATPPTTAAKH